MSELAERILNVRKDTGLSQSAFGEKLNISQNFVWMLESGKRSPSDRTISDICRIFGIDEVWLRTGEGEMRAPSAQDDQLAATLADAAARRETAKQRILRAVAMMPDEDFPAIERFILTWIEANKPPESSENPPEK